MDQDPVHCTPLHQQGSARVGSVWSNDGPRKSVEASGGHIHLGSGPRDIKNRRYDAAAFVNELTEGEPIPYASDVHFRRPLRNGVLLCKVMSRLMPGSIPQVYAQPNDDQAKANRAAFFKALSSMNVPANVQFSEADLDAEDDTVPRERVTDCLLFLKKVYSDNSSVPTPYPGAFQNDVVACRDSPKKAGLHSTPPGLTRQLALNFSQVAAPASASSGAAAGTSPSPPIAYSTGVNHLMTTCYNVHATNAAVASQLSQQMTMIPGMMAGPMMPYMQPGSMELVHYQQNHLQASVHSVVSNLTSEYEHRLLAKDNELVKAQEAIKTLQKRLDQMQSELVRIQMDMQADKQRALEAEKEASGEAERGLRQQITQLLEDLAQKEGELASLQHQLDSDDSGAQQLKQQLEVMAGVESRYRKIQEENRKLYNQVQDLRGAIRIFARVRPLGVTGDRTSDGCIDVGVDGAVAAIDAKGTRRDFAFDKVFEANSTQTDIYADTQPLIRSVMDGFNVCIFAYGQTGSGKTHTMTGTNVENKDGQGINYRALDDLFHLRHERSPEFTYTIKVQMVEIYNETLNDLLCEEPRTAKQLTVLSTQPSGLNVPGATQLEVNTTDDVVEMMNRGASNRKFAETKMNERSSRSHQILTVIVDGANTITGARSHACLHLVDLAGSERTDKSGAEGERMTEANSINKSLTSLGQVMLGLASKQQHVPFRNSLLTQLLQDSLSGSAKVMMFMHIAPESASSSETMSTLQFGTRVKGVSLGQAKANAESGRLFEAHEQLKRRDQEAACLKAELQRCKATEDSLRREVAELKAMVQRRAAPAESCESFRTAQTATDTAQSTPASSVYGRPPPTPRGQGMQRGAYTPRGTALRTPSRVPSLQAGIEQLHQQQQTPISRAADSSGVRGPLERQLSVPTVRGIGSATPSSSMVSAAGPSHPSASAVLLARPSGIPVRNIPRYDPSEASSQAQDTAMRGSLSARHTSRYTAVPVEPQPRGSMTSRNSGTFGSSRPAAALATVADAPAVRRTSSIGKGSTSSRISGGWKS